MSPETMSTRPIGCSDSPSLPAWHTLCASLKGIFDRQYYTENGPLARELETRLREITGFNHVICTINEMVAYLMVFDTLDPGEVIVPSGRLLYELDCFAWLPQLEAVRCDMGGGPNGIAKLATTSTRAVLLPTPGPSASDLRKMLRGNILTFCDTTSDPLAFRSGADAHICSMHGGFPLGAAEGAYIATDDADLADLIRTMRSSSGVSRRMEVKKTVNGRLSEAHAALALLSLDRLTVGKVTRR